MRPRPRVRSGAQSHESKQEILSSLWIEFSEFSLRALKIYTRHTVSIMETPKTVTPKYGFTPKFRKKIDLFRKKFGNPATGGNDQRYTGEIFDKHFLQGG